MASSGTKIETDLPPTDMVTLYSEEGESFQIEKAAAMKSGTIRSMLEGGFEESETNTVRLQIR